MATHGKLHDRMLVASNAPTIALWILVLALGAGTLVMSLEAGAVAWDGVLATAVVIAVIAILARVRGWHFLPW